MGEEPGPAWVQVDVTDDGPGLDPDQLTRVFERFYRADGSRTGGGSGLGLSIVQAVVESHDGQVGCSSVSGAGGNVLVPAASDLGPGSDLGAVTVPRLCPGSAQVSFGEVRFPLGHDGFGTPRTVAEGPSAARRRHPVRSAFRGGAAGPAAGGARGGRVLLRRFDGCEHRCRHICLDGGLTVGCTRCRQRQRSVRCRVPGLHRLPQEERRDTAVVLPPATVRAASPAGSRPRVRAALHSGAGSAVGSAPRAHRPRASAPMRGPRRSRPVPRSDRRSLPVRVGRAEPVASMPQRWRRTSPASRTTASR